ncbi:MAG: hypothetical protein ACJ76J_22405 [Thermoanaerobaculia bacterium]
MKRLGAKETQLLPANGENEQELGGLGGLLRRKKKSDGGDGN